MSEADTGVPRNVSKRLTVAVFAALYLAGLLAIALFVQLTGWSLNNGVSVGLLIGSAFFASEWRMRRTDRAPTSKEALGLALGAFMASVVTSAALVVGTAAIIDLQGLADISYILVSLPARFIAMTAVVVFCVYLFVLWLVFGPIAWFRGRRRAR
ncbi:MAG: ABZJ_00895 family protein [Pseudomonadota bacterium]